MPVAEGQLAGGSQKAAARGQLRQITLAGQQPSGAPAYGSNKLQLIGRNQSARDFGFQHLADDFFLTPRKVNNSGEENSKKRNPDEKICNVVSDALSRRRN